MKYNKFIQNIKDQMKEAQMKLGFAKETVRLYYPVKTLNAMLGVKAKDAKEMLVLLEDEAFQKSELGTLHFSSHKQRIEVSVSPEGAEYVHKYVEEPGFLKALIELFRENHYCTLQDIEDLFKNYLYPLTQWYKRKDGLNYSSSKIYSFKFINKLKIQKINTYFRNLVHV